MKLPQEIARRRTFAIISHPDAGKTTLTEKFLLYGGALHLAGTVKGRRAERATASDWMELERQRGISISSTILQFEYRDFVINLLDTPGHEDFSEDTYRVLTAVDAAVMVVDAAKGIEVQTRKLFEVCRMRGIPIFTFINKCDRPGKDPLALIDEVEEVLGIEVFPANWPLGAGSGFRGIFDRLANKVHLFERAAGGKYKAPLSIGSITDPTVKDRLGEAGTRQVAEEVEILEAAGASFDVSAIAAGKLTPVFFGSALNNFGVQLLLDGFLDHAPAPGPRPTNKAPVTPDAPFFSGFVFKIQANMNPRHRDRVAFVRICSGKFERDMVVTHERTGKPLRLSFSHRLFGRERETSDEAWPGDVIGIAGHAALQIGDTLTTDPDIAFAEIPRFAPESFAFLHNEDTQNLKRFRSGVDQLLQEKLVQRFFLLDSTNAIPLLGAVGQLQFDVVRHRLEEEYRTPTRMEPAPWVLTRWVPADVTEETLRALRLGPGVSLARDDEENLAILFESEWSLRYFRERESQIPLLETPNGLSRAIVA